MNTDVNAKIVKLRLGQWSAVLHFASQTDSWPPRHCSVSSILYHLNQFGTLHDPWHAGRICQFNSLASWLWSIWNFHPICLELTMTSAQPCLINKKMLDDRAIKWRENFLSLHSFFNNWGNLSGLWHKKSIWQTGPMSCDTTQISCWQMGPWCMTDELIQMVQYIELQGVIAEWSCSLMLVSTNGKKRGMDCILIEDYRKWWFPNNSTTLHYHLDSKISSHCCLHTPPMSSNFHIQFQWHSMLCEVTTSFPEIRQ